MEHEQKPPMTQAEITNLLVELTSARAQLAVMSHHYDNLYYRFLNEIKRHYPLEPQ